MDFPSLFDSFLEDFSFLSPLADGSFAGAEAWTAVGDGMASFSMLFECVLFATGPGVFPADPFPTAGKEATLAGRGGGREGGREGSMGKEVSVDEERERERERKGSKERNR